MARSLHDNLMITHRSYVLREKEREFFPLCVALSLLSRGTRGGLGCPKIASAAACASTRARATTRMRLVLSWSLDRLGSSQRNPRPVRPDPSAGRGPSFRRVSQFASHPSSVLHQVLFGIAQPVLRPLSTLSFRPCSSGRLLRRTNISLTLGPHIHPPFRRPRSTLHRKRAGAPSPRERSSSRRLLSSRATRPPTFAHLSVVVGE